MDTYNYEVEETIRALNLVRSLKKEMVKKVLEKLGYRCWEVIDVALGDKYCCGFEDDIAYSEEPLIFVRWDIDGYDETFQSLVFPISWLYDNSYLITKHQNWRNSIRIAKEKAQLAEQERIKQEKEKAEKELYLRLKEKYEGK